MKILHEHIISCKPHGINLFCWTFYCVDDRSKLDVDIPQLICCVISYNDPMSFTIFTQRTRLKKGLVFYFKNNGLIALKKHLNANHGLSAKKFEKNEHRKSHGKTICKGKTCNKWECNLQLFVAIDFYKKDHVHQKEFVKNLGLLVVKKHLPI